MPTAYLTMIDEAALREHLAIERVGTWEGELPFGEIVDLVKTNRFSNCTDLQVRGSSAGYNVMEGLQQPEEFGEGTYFAGMQYLPIVAFHERMYFGVTERIAEALAGYDTIVARVFERGVVRGARGRVGDFQVEFYGAEMEWCGNGHFGEEVVVWKVAEAAVVDSTPLEEADGTPAPEDAEDATDEATEAVAEPVEEAEAEPQKPTRRTRLAPVAAPA